MSTIACRDGVMASDTLGCRGSIVRKTKKIYRLSDGIIGFSGNYQDGLSFVEWWRRGHDMSVLPEFRQYGRDGDAPDFSAIVLTGNGLAEWTEHFQPMPIFDEFFAIGSGAMAATAAMVMGATAVEAVRVAMRVDINTGGEVAVEGWNGD